MPPFGFNASLKSIYTLNFQISYPFTYSIINLSLYIFHHPRPVLDVRIPLRQFITIVVHVCICLWDFVLRLLYGNKLIHSLLFYLKGQTFEKKLILWYCVGGDGVNHVLFLAKEQSMFPSFFTAVNWNVFLLNFRWAFLYFCWLPFDVFQQNWSESRLCIIFKFFQKKWSRLLSYD